MDIKTLLETQRAFNHEIYGNLPDEKKEEITKSLMLALHAEASSIASSVNFKDHTSHRIQINKDKLLYESVDAFRYILALLNTWDISADSFSSAFSDKDSFLWIRRESEKRTWAGQDVVLVDIDDVLAEFRRCFFDWIHHRYSVEVDIEGESYYTVNPLVDAGLHPESIFQEFLAGGGMSRLDLVPGALAFLEELRSAGFWIHLLTARPEDNPRCFYDTFLWLRRVNIPFDRVSFAPEKFRWASQSPYYGKCKIIAIDDSPKHSAEYAKHGIPVVSPILSYNKEIHGLPGVHTYGDLAEAADLIKRIAGK